MRGASLIGRAGEIVAVLGPNGAGKSSLIKAVAGLIPIEAGSVRLDGEDLTGGAGARAGAARRSAYVPQTENVFR